MRSPLRGEGFLLLTVFAFFAWGVGDVLVAPDRDDGVGDELVMGELAGVGDELVTGELAGVGDELVTGELAGVGDPIRAPAGPPSVTAGELAAACFGTAANDRSITSDGMPRGVSVSDRNECMKSGD